MVDRELGSKAQEWFQLADSLAWKSFDPFDLLLSPYLGNLQTVSPLMARVCIQLGKRSGAASRRLAKVQPHEEAKTLSDYLLAGVLFSKCGQEWARPYLPELAQKLLAKSISSAHGLGWGLEFPYTNRFINAPARTPNIYQTISAVQSLLGLYELTHHQNDLNVAVQGGNFIIHDLGAYEHNGMLWFRYWPLSNDLIVNVQASVAGAFLRLGALTNEPKYFELANAGMQTVLKTQREDGSWYYSCDGKADFVDGFHTGFILQELVEYAAHCPDGNASKVNLAIQQGLNFFRMHLVGKSGLPLDFADGRASPDGQNFAQCVQTFARCSQAPSDIEMGLRLWQSMIKIRALNRNTYQQLRWSYAPAVLATAHLFQIVSQNK